MKNNYLKNVMKSVAYAASDVVSDYIPSTKEFTSSNKEFATATYAALKNPKQFMRRQVQAIKENKIYQALDYGAKNLVEDLRTGNFYNKARKERDEIKLSGLDDNWDDLTEFGVDKDWEKNASASDAAGEITAGDMKVVDAIEGSNAAVASATVNAVVSSSQNEIKANRTNTAMLYTQNERLFSGLHNDMTVLGNTMQQMYKLQSASLQNIDNNLSTFFTQQSKLNEERNAMLKEILELQRNAYKSAADKEKDKQKTSGRIRWSDINSGGIPNISTYFNAVKKNIASELSSVMPAGFGGEDSNMLATFMTSPLEGVMKYVINGVIPATVKQAAKEFDGSLSGIFGNAIGMLGNARSKNEGGLLGTLAKFLGVSTSVNRNIDTSRYEKGPIPFDGITRKAIIDVIPTHLRRIEAAITGRPEEMFDYKSGRWIKVSDLKRQFDDIKKNAVRSATSELRSAMKHGADKVRKGLTRKSDISSWDQALEEFDQFIYDNNGRFNPKVSASKNGIDSLSYPNLYKHYNKIKTVYKDFDAVESKDKNGKIRTRHTRNRIRMQLSNSVLDAKDSEEKQYRDIETDVTNALSMYFGGPKSDSHGKYNDKGAFTAFNNLNSTKDDLGNTIFDYLQNINRELTWFRLHGGAHIISGSSRRKGKKLSSKDFEKSFTDIDLRNSSIKNINDYTKISDENERIKKSALQAIASGKAVDLRDLTDDELEVALRLSTMVRNNAVDEYADEVNGYNKNAISGWIDKHFIKTNIKNLKDVEKAIEKADAEGKNTNEVNMDAKEEKFFQKIMKRVGQGGSIFGGIIGASSEAFTNLLYTADKAIYEMMYKAEISDDENGGKKYNGFMDAMVGKMTDTFKKVTDRLKSDVIDPFLERFGIDKDFKGRFKDSLINSGSKLWTSFRDANKSVYGPLWEQLKVNLGFEPGETTAQKRRASNRTSTKSKINKLKNVNNAFDPEFQKLAKEFGLNWEDYYDDVEKGKKEMLSSLYEEMYKNSNGLKEYDNDKDSLEMMFEAMASNPKFMEHFAKKIGYKIKGATTEEQMEELRKQHALLTDRSDKTRRDRQYALAAKGEDGTVARQVLMDEYNLGETREEKEDRIKAIAKWQGAKLEDLSKYTDDDALNKAFIRIMEHNNANGTMGTPFMGKSYLTKGEVVFNGRGASVVPKTGKYNISSPSHILNTEQSHDLGITKGPRVSIAQAAAKERMAAKRNGDVIASNAKGSMKITNDAAASLDPKELLSEAKSYIPEAASGGLIGGILSMVLGLAGGPLVGAAIGAGGSILASSGSLKEKLFGKSGADGKRDGSGIISKTIMDKFHKYFPDMAKYGLAGLIPGLITPLGPIGGIMAGAAFGFLKNNEKFTNKYLGEDGPLHIGSKEKAIIQDLLPKALKGAGVGAIVGTLIGGPFGLLGNAALGAGLGMMGGTEEFKNLILGEKDENGERSGGIFGAFKEALKPFGESMKEAGTTLKQAFEENIITPLSKFIKPAIHALPIAIKSIPKLISSGFDKLFGTKIGKTIDTWTKKILNKPVKLAGGLLKGGAKLIKKATAGPGKLVSKVGDKLRAYDIRHGDLVDMDAKEAVGWMDTTGRGDQVKSTLRAVAGIGEVDEEGNRIGMSVEEARSLANNLAMMGKTEADAKSDFKSAKKNLNQVLTGWKTEDGKGLSQAQIDGILKAAETKDFAKISDLLQKRSLDGSREGMTQAEFNTFMNDKLKAAVTGAADAKNRLLDIKTVDQSELGEKLKADLATFGIGDDFNFANKRDREDFIKLLNDQLIHLEANPEELSLENDTNKGVNRIADTLDNVYLVMRALATNDPKERAKILGKIKDDKAKESAESTVGEAEKVKNDIESSLNMGQSHANTVYAENRKKAVDDLSQTLGQEEVDKLSEKSHDLLTTNKYKRRVKHTKKFGIDALNVTNDRFRNANKATGIFVDNELAKYLTPEAHVRLSEITRASATKIKKVLKRRVISNTIINGNYEITPEVIDFLIDVDLIELERRCTVLSQCFNKKHGGSVYKRYKSLMEIYELGYDDLRKLIIEFGVEYTDATSSWLKNAGRGSKKGLKTTFGVVGKYGVKPVLKTAGWTVKTGAKGIKYGTRNAYDRMYGVHNDKWHRKHDKQDYVDLNDYVTETNYEPETSDDIVDLNDYATNTKGEATQGNFLGTLLGVGSSILGGLWSGVKAVGGLAINGAKSLVSGVANGAKSLINGGGNKKSVGMPGMLAGMNTFANHNQSAQAAPSGGNFNETDKPGDGKDHIQVGNEGDIIAVERDSSGNIQPDTGDSHTKSVLNKLSLKERATQKLQAAQLKASELIKNTFDTTGMKESKGGKIGWLGLLLGGVLLAKSGLLTKLYEGVIKPIWTDHVYPWITDKAVPWVKDTLLPGIGNMFMSGIKYLIGELPSIIGAAIKGFGGILDAFTGNKTNVGATTKTSKSDISNVYDENHNKLTTEQITSGKYKLYNANNEEISSSYSAETYYDINGNILTPEKLASGKYKAYNSEGIEVSDNYTGVYDKEGNPLTVDQIVSGEYDDNMYNAQGAKGTISKDGEGIQFEDGSFVGSSYLATVGGASLKNFARKATGYGAKLAAKITTKAEKLIAKGGIRGYVGKGIKYFANDGLLHSVSKAGDKLFKGKGLVRKVTGGALKAITKPLEASGKLGTKFNTTVSEAFTKEAAEAAAKETAEEAVERATAKQAVKVKPTKTTTKKSVKVTPKKVGDTKITADPASKKANIDIDRTVTKEMAEEAAETAAREATEKAARAGVKSTIKNSKTMNLIRKGIDYLFGDSSFFSKASGVAKNLGKKPKNWVKSLKSKVTDAFEDAVGKAAKSMGSTALKVVGKVLWWVFLITDFLTGCDQAEAILGVTETSIGEELVAGIIKAICGLTTILEIVPGVPFIAQLIWTAVYGDDFIARQEQATKEWEEWKKQTGSTASKEEYLKSKYSYTGKFQSWLDKKIRGVKEKEVVKDQMTYDDVVNGTNTTTIEYTANSKGTLPSANFGTGKYSKQIDPSISGIRFNSSSDSEYQTIGTSACGPAAAVNAIEYMHGTGNNVTSAAKFALNHGYKETNGGTKPGFFTDYFNLNGYSSKTSYNKNQIENNINDGLPTVIMGKDPNGTSSSTPFGKNPHYVTVTGTDGKGNAIVQDPESKYDDQLYPIKNLMKNTSLGVSAYSKKGKGKFGLGTWGMGEGEYDSKVYNYLINNMNMTKAGAAGLMANLYHESGINPYNAEQKVNNYLKISDELYTSQVDDGTIPLDSKDGESFLHYKGGNTESGYGLAQWTSVGRKKALYTLAKDNNASIADLSVQLTHLNNELSSSYKSVLDVLQTTQDYNEATKKVMDKFEVPGVYVKTLKTDDHTPTQENFDDYNKELSDRQKDAARYYSDTNFNTSDTIDSSGVNNTTSYEATKQTSSVFDKVYNSLSDLIINSDIGQILNRLFNPGSDSSTDSSIFNGVVSGGIAEKVASIATAEVNKPDSIEQPIKDKNGKVLLEGNTNNVKYNDWFYTDAYPTTKANWSERPWCAAFVSWVANEAGALAKAIPRNASVPSLRKTILTERYGAVEAYNKSRSVTSENDPANAVPGDLITFDNPSPKRSGLYNHIGIVTGVKDGRIYTVEGNTGNSNDAEPSKVSSYDYDLTDSYISAILKPAYHKVPGSKEEEEYNKELAEEESTEGETTEGETETTEESAEGRNGVKPLSRFGQFKNSLCGTGNLDNKSNSNGTYKTTNTFNNLHVSMPKNSSITREHIKNSGMGTQAVFGMSKSIDYTKLINSIISVLMTIADNTDKLNTIVSILNNKLNLNISASDVSNATSGSKSLKSKLSNALNGANASSSNNTDYSSINSIINAMNAIASE